MSGPSLSGGIPVITGRIVESTGATRPFRKIGESVLIKELEVVIEEFRRELSNLNLHTVAHDRLVSFFLGLKAAFEDLWFSREA